MFLLATFASVRSLLDMGSSTAFFTFLSQRQRSLHFVGWYFAWLGIQFLIPFLAIAFFFPVAWIEIIWKVEQRSLVIIAFVAAYVQSVLWAAVLQMGESQRMTRGVQGVALLIALVHFVMMFLALWGEWLEVRWILVVASIEFVVAATLTATRLNFPLRSKETDSFKRVVTEFWGYCFPLIPYAWFSFAYTLTDRWLLQNYSGSVQQAYYSVADQFSAIATIATASILNVFWKEIAEAHKQNHHQRVVLLYSKVLYGLFFIAAAVAGFLAPWAESILHITLGAAFVGGSGTLMIMLFYPLHQSIGQICGVMAYATGHVAAYVKIGMLAMSLSMMVTYFVLADSTGVLPGLGLGSEGLAGKMVVMQILSVNALAFYLSRSLNIKFEWGFQPLVTLACVTFGFLAYLVSHALFDLEAHLFLAFMVAGLIYAILLFALIRMAPSFAGLHRNEIDAAIAVILRLVRR